MLGNAAQAWLFKDGTIVTAMNVNKCVDGGPDMPKGFELFLWDCNGYPQQQWDYDEEGMHTIYLTESASELDATLCIDIPGGDVASGNRIWTWDCTGYVAQQFSKVA